MKHNILNCDPRGVGCRVDAFGRVVDKNGADPCVTHTAQVDRPKERIGEGNLTRRRDNMQRLDGILLDSTADRNLPNLCPFRRQKRSIVRIGQRNIEGE